MKFNEQQIKERRTVEAMQKEYMGFQGKIVCIARNLGNEILDQGQTDQTFLNYDNYWKINKDNIEKIDIDANVSFLGWQYDALGIGINLEIFVFEDEKKIKVSYDGKTVYEETLGELDIYTPDNIWEDKIESILKLAKLKEKNNKQNSKENAKIEFEKRKKNLLDELNYKWGI
jgi:hypothetical protein